MSSRRSPVTGCITSPGLGTLGHIRPRGCLMSSEPQPTPQGAPLPRHAPGDEVPPPPEAPVLPGAVYPAEDAVLPGAAEAERPGTAPEQPAPAAPPPSHAAP